MSGDWSQAKGVLTDAIRLSESDRRRFIAAACINQPELRDELLSILASYDAAARACGAAGSGSTTLAGVVPPADLRSPKKPAPVLLSGTTYGPYRVLKPLGAGGMGQVFLAVDVRLDRRVAIKSLAGSWLESPTARHRLMQEARSAGALTHPHIATLYDVLEDTGHLLLVMEYVEGRSVGSRLEEGPIPIGHALRLAIQIADAVSYAHDRGIIHCDIKPANVQIAVDGSAKVLDFGLARARYDTRETDEVAIAERGTLLGTLGYMAPERLVEGTLNASGDIYSLGVVIFEMITGQRFFDGRDLPAFLLAVLGSHVPKPSAAVSWVPTAVDEVVMRALAKKPALRYQSARELSRDLHSVLALVEGSTSRVLPVRPGPHVQQTEGARRASAVAVGAIAVFAVLTLAGFATSTMYDSALGITPAFQSESVWSWPLWGFRSLIGPTAYLLTAAVVLTLILGVCRLCLAAPPMLRWCKPLTAARRDLTRRLMSLSIPDLAQLLLIAHCALFALSLWLFSDFVQAFDVLMTSNKAGDLSALSPANREQHKLYRALFSIELWTFGAAWYALLKLRAERHERRIHIGIAAGGLLITLTLFFLVLPYRILWHNEHERVFYDSQTCYLVAQRQNDALLFCPMREPPRNVVIRSDDAQLVRGGGEEDVFSRVNGRK